MRPEPSDLDDLRAVVVTLFEAGAVKVFARKTRGGAWEIEASREVATPPQKPPLRVK